MRPSNPHRLALPPQLWRFKPIQLTVIDFLDWLFPFVIINLLWVLLSLTVVLMPPATAALFETVAGAYRNQAPIPRVFLSRIWHWVGKSWLWAGANGLVFGGLFAVARTVYPNEIPLALCGVAAILIAMVQFYFWPYVMVQEQPELLRALRNTVFTVLSDLPYVILFLALAGVILIPAVVVIAPVLFAVPVLLAMLSTYSLIVWLEQHGLLKSYEREL